ncbi:MAG: hypothetical protein IT478_02415 [Xanthomonadales bacterium]|nr:hypothetical protein [Xanthomonadales bacterium]
MATLTLGATTVTLSDDFEFPEEFDWSLIQIKKTYSVTGALIIQTGTKQVGRSITLQGDDQHAWVSRADLATLRTLANTAGALLTLVFRTVTYSVMFDHEAGAIDAQPVADFDVPDPADWYVVTLRFFVV